MTASRLRRGVFQSVADLVAAIEEYIRVYSAAPKPFVWTAFAGEIVENVGRCKAILGTLD